MKVYKIRMERLSPKRPRNRKNQKPAQTIEQMPENHSLTLIGILGNQR